MDRRAEQLIDKHLDGCITQAEAAELDRLLVQHPAVAEALWETAHIDALLAIYWQGEAAVAVLPVRAAKSAGPARRALRRSLFVVAAGVLLVAVIIGLLQWDQEQGYRLMAGTVEVAGVPVSSITDNHTLRVVSNQAAVIRLAGGSRAELGPSTLAVFRGRNELGAQVIELLEGEGRFCVPRAAPPLCVHTAAGSVTAATTEFQVKLWPTEGKGDEQMQFRSLLVLAVAVSSGMVEVHSPDEHCVLPAGVQAVFGAETTTGGKSRDLSNWLPSGTVLGFTQKGAPFAVEKVLPGLTAALRLSDEQKKKLADAVDQTIDRREVRAAMALAKLDPKATETQKQEARRLVEQARAELKKQVDQILTAEQKALVEKLNTAVADAQAQVRDAMKDQFQALKNDPSNKEKVQKEYQERMRAAVEQRVMKLLDPDAQAAVKKAAAAQAAADKSSKSKTDDKKASESKADEKKSAEGKKDDQR